MFELNGKWTNAIIYTDLIEETAIGQILGLCNHPAFEGAKIRVMPDVHAGAGCTIGTTMDITIDRVIPNIVGVDIGCGVRSTVFETENINFEELEQFIENNIPSGCNVRADKHPNLSKEIEQDVENICEDLAFADMDYHLNSIGSMGGGNHYIEIGQISDNRFVLSVHTGSRNLGKKVCEYFQQIAENNYDGKDMFEKAKKDLISEYKRTHREKEISSAISTLEKTFKVDKRNFPKDLAYIEGANFDRYMLNMRMCQRVAAENRKLISEDILNFLGVKALEEFDTIHNYIEDLSANGNCKFIIRKGAIRANKGEKVAIPLNMKDGVIIGVGKGNSDWNCSAPHGAGRLLSRAKAKETLSVEDFADSMKDINTWSVGKDTLDEAPGAYKPADMIVEQVKDTIEILDIVKPVYNYKDHTPVKSWAEIKKERKKHV